MRLVKNRRRKEFRVFLLVDEAISPPEVTPSDPVRGALDPALCCPLQCLCREKMRTVAARNKRKWSEENEAGIFTKKQGEMEKEYGSNSATRWKKKKKL